MVLGLGAAGVLGSKPRLRIQSCVECVCLKGVDLGSVFVHARGTHMHTQTQACADGCTYSQSTSYLVDAADMR